MMAETKTRAPSSGAKARRKRAKPRKTSANRAPSKSKQRKRTSTNGAGQVDSARKAVESTAKQAGHSVSEAGHSIGRAANKAKTPLIAGGAAAAGAAGGLALGAHQARKSKGLRRPKVKIRSQDLARAARDVGQFGMDVGQLAGELRKNREVANGASHRSPVEVVLDGLTHRRRDN
jgi:hypothetical protein